MDSYLGLQWITSKNLYILILIGVILNNFEVLKFERLE